MRKRNLQTQIIGVKQNILRMIYSTLNKWKEIPGLINSPVFKKAFEWIEENAEQAEEGFYQLGIDGFYVRVMSYSLKERENAKYECHSNTIDLQFTIAGAEGIEINRLEMLESYHNYSEEKDVEHFKTPTGHIGYVVNYQHSFTILFPGEPHMPQLKVAGYDTVKKLVVKIPSHLFNSN